MQSALLCYRSGKQRKDCFINVPQNSLCLHMIATAVRNILPLDEPKEVSLLDDDDKLSAAVGSVITACKSLVSYIKRSGLNNKLASTLKQANDTRWNSLLVMLESIKKAKDELKNLLEIIHKQEKFEKIDLNVVEVLVHFLKPFEEATRVLEGVAIV